MEEERHLQSSTYSKLSADDNEYLIDSLEGQGQEEFHDEQNESAEEMPEEYEEVESTPSVPSFWDRVGTILNTNVHSDQGLVILGFPLVEGEFTIKFLKFLFLTFASIAVVHKIVEQLFDDRDKSMTLMDVWHFDMNLIVMDCLSFFVVGRMWKQRGVDHLAWILPVIVCNLYFESQNFVGWLQHSVSLYEIHCLWPWQLWIFVLILVPTIGGLAIAHVVWAWKERILLVKLVELFLCFLFFLSPVMSSRYFHLHHWFAGWLLGMHCNYDVWWSRAAMAYCWGMYINGIAVYGRDPVLTCEYAYFLTIDNSCPYVDCYLEALQDMQDHPHNATHVVHEMKPVDWRNCSASGYHP